MKVPAVPDTVRSGVLAVMSDLVPNNDEAGFVAGRPAYIFDPPPGLTTSPAVLRFLLHYVCGCRDLGRFEKTAWECVFTYRGVAASIAHRKLGVHLYLDRGAFPDPRQARALATDVHRSLRRAWRIMEQGLLRDFARSQLHSGHITILNQCHRLREMVDYFRDGASEAYAGRGRMPRETSLGTRIFSQETEAFFNSVAMVNAYFSWLEHVLVLALPFADDAASLMSVTEFIRKRWHEKFAALFNLDRDRRAKQTYDQLRDLADRYRNPYAHGLLDARVGAIWFHLPGCGAVSMTLSQPENTPSFYLLPFDRRGFDEAGKRLAAADQFLREHPRTCYGVQWAEGGLHVAYDQESRQQYARASIDDESFAAFLEYSGYMADQDANMDW